MSSPKSKAETVDMLDDVDPDVRRFVDSINQGYAAYPDLDVASYSRRREIAEAIRVPWRTGGPEMADSCDHDVGGVRVRVHRPRADTDRPALFYLHGGGWTLFSIDTHDRLMREYAARADVTVIGIDYSLSPEAKFPVALDEIEAVIKWARDTAATIGIDPKRLAIGGDSAGANLAVATCLRLREAGAPQLQAMLLNYGAFSPEPTPSYDRYGGPSYCLTPPEMDGFWRNYVNSDEELDNPLVAPLKADLRDMPPAFVAIAELDILADCNHALAEKLEQAGVPVTAMSYASATHSFLEAMSIASLARRALDEQAHWLNRLLCGIYEAHDPAFLALPERR